MDKPVNKDVGHHPSPLLVFAHSGEAQSFIKSDSLKKSSPHAKPWQYYQGKNYNLLVTGGGRDKTLVALTYCLSNSQVSKIINLGIAASLNLELKMHNIYLVSTVYGHSDKPIYDSFSLLSPKPRTSNICDCISVSSPVNQKDLKQKLSGFADLADMELWWIAYVSHCFQIPVQAVKLISDDGENVVKEEIQASTEMYSQKMFSWYKENLDNQSKASNHHTPSPPPLPTLKDEIEASLHFTVAQKKIFDSLFPKLPVKDIQEVKKLLNWEDIMAKNIAPKQKTKLLLDKIKDYCFPVSQKYHQHLKSLMDTTEEFDIGFDPKLESSEITCFFKASTLDEWEKKKSKLATIPAKNIFSLLQGHAPPPV